jgi:hypothetical protein
MRRCSDILGLKSCRSSLNEVNITDLALDSFNTELSASFYLRSPLVLPEWMANLGPERACND